MKDLLKSLCGLYGPSGDETDIREFIISQIKGFADYRVDKMGNIIVFKKGKKSSANKIMVDAHMDEVGIIITSISSDGFLKFDTIGGIDPMVLMSKRIVFKNGVKGVVGSKPVHLSSAEERKKIPKIKDLCIDIGASTEAEALSLVQVGDAAVFDCSIIDLGNLLMGKAIDDRVGCAILINLIRQDSEYDYYATFSVLEEVGLRGARVAAFSVEPDYSIVLEATTAADINGIEPDNTVCKVGAGAVISFMDKSTLYDKNLFKRAFKMAAEKNIKVQVKSTVAGGNNAGAIHQSRDGVKTIAISVPCRYIHSPSGVACYDDVVAVNQLASAMINEIGLGFDN